MPRFINHPRRRFVGALAAVALMPYSGLMAGDDAKKGPMSKTALLLDDLSLEHDTGPDHPESPERYRTLKKLLTEEKFADRLAQCAARDATDDELRLCHTEAYLKSVQRDHDARKRALSTGDTPMSPRSLEAARRAAGAAMSAVDLVMQGKHPNAFCLVRPPGHHATPARGMGFCFFNNIALAARYAQKKHGVGKVLIVDWDVHHGNGTQDIFYEDGSVFVFNTHQSPWYPGTGDVDETGAGKGLGMIMNCPFAAGSGRKEIVGAFKDKLGPAVEKLKPEVILVSAGFDSRHGDPLGHFTLTDEDFADLTKLVMQMAAGHCKGRLISVLEGGYNLKGLSAAVAAHVGALSQR